MSRGVSSGGGQSSLDYLFGSGEDLAPKPAATNVEAPHPGPTHVAPEKASAVAPPAEGTKQIPAGIQGTQKNNYHRSDGQNTGNFVTDRPSTRVKAAPGGGSSLGYLFGDGRK